MNGNKTGVLSFSEIFFLEVRAISWTSMDTGREKWVFWINGNLQFSNLINLVENVFLIILAHLHNVSITECL